MSKKVQAAVLDSISHMTIREFDMPRVGNNDGLLKIEMAGVCGTDPKIYKGKVNNGDLPMILGHEILGRIAKVSEQASARWKVKKGDRVIVEPFVHCGNCSRCLSGEYRFCENGFSYGTVRSSIVPPHLWGAYAEYMYLHPDAIVHKITETLPAEAAVMITAVVADGIRWGRLVGDFSIQDAVVIQGAGPQGLTLVMVARESGCSPIIITGLSRDKERFKLAREFGADYAIDVEQEDVIKRVSDLTDGHMADVVVDVAGSPEAIPLSIELAKRHGTLVFPTLVGVDVSTPLITDKLVIKELKFIAAYSSDSVSISKAIKLVESRKYPIEKMVTHRFTLAEAERAVQTAAGQFKDQYPIKCVIIP